MSGFFDWLHKNLVMIYKSIPIIKKPIINEFQPKNILKWFNFKSIWNEGIINIFFYFEMNLL